MPDVIGRLEYSDNWGAVQLSGLTHYDGYKVSPAFGPPAVVDSSISRQQFAGFAALWLQNFWGDDTFGIESTFGAAGRYLNAEANEAVLFLSPTGQLSMSTVDVWGGAIYYTHFWRPDLRSTVAYGHMHAYYGHAVGFTTLDSVQTVHANLIWSPVKMVDIGLEYMWGQTHWGNVAPGSNLFGGGATSNSGEDSRLMASMRVKFD